MKFQQAREQDKEEIFALYRSLAGTEYCAWSAEYPGMQEIEGDLARNALFCMKDTDGTIVGTISIDDDPAVDTLPCWSPALQPSAELSRIGVLSEYQNRGIAREMLICMMEELRKQGKKSVHLLVCKTNVKALRSYDKLRFSVAGEAELFGKTWWCYEKEL